MSSYCTPVFLLDSLCGTDELAHWEMLGVMLMQSLEGANTQEIKEAGLECWSASHGIAPFPADCNGNNWTAAYVGTTGDPVAALTNNMAAEQKARAGYEGVIRLCDDPDFMGPLQFLRQREIVHFQRFGEALNIIQDKTAKKKCY